jgi:probable phosphoglycerate mutase
MTAATRLILARHGQAHCNVLGAIGGPRGCTGLTDHGRHQVQQLAERLRAEHDLDSITAAYASPLPRARESAAIIADRLAIPIAVDPDLREPDYGDADGQLWTDVVAAFGGIPAQHADRPVAAGAETWTAYLRRATATLRAILDRHAGGTILIVGHGETVAAAAHHFLDLTAEIRAHVGFAAHYAGLTRWEQQPLSWTRPSL